MDKDDVRLTELVYIILAHRLLEVFKTFPIATAMGIDISKYLEESELLVQKLIKKEIKK